MILQKEVTGQKVLASLKPAEQLIKVVHDRLKAFLGGQDAVPFTFQLPSVVMVMGLQGSGKTTSIAKMAYLVSSEAQAKGKSRRILLASVDFYRPAAIDQLEILCKASARGNLLSRAQALIRCKRPKRFLPIIKRSFLNCSF